MMVIKHCAECGAEYRRSSDVSSDVLEPHGLCPTCYIHELTEPPHMRKRFGLLAYLLLMTGVIAFITSLLSGCANTPAQRRAWTIGASIVVTSIALTAATHGRGGGSSVPHEVQRPSPPCASGPEACR